MTTHDVRFTAAARLVGILLILAAVIQLAFSVPFYSEMAEYAPLPHVYYGGEICQFLLRIAVGLGLILLARAADQHNRESSE